MRATDTLVAVIAAFHRNPTLKAGDRLTTSQVGALNALLFAAAEDNFDLVDFDIAVAACKELIFGDGTDAALQRTIDLARQALGLDGARFVVKATISRIIGDIRDRELCYMRIDPDGRAVFSRDGITEATRMNKAEAERACYAAQLFGFPDAKIEAVRIVERRTATEPRRSGEERRADPAGAGDRRGRFIRSGFDRRKAKRPRRKPEA